MPSRPTKHILRQPPPQFRSDLNQPVTRCRGVGPKIARLLSKLDVLTIEDLLLHFPRTYLDRRHVIPIALAKVLQPAVIIAEVTALRAWRSSRRLHITRCTVRDRTGSLNVIWFNQSFLSRQIMKGTKVILSGIIVEREGLQLENPDVEIVDDEKRNFLHTLALIPVYPLTEGMGQKRMRRLIRTALDDFLDTVPETLPQRIIRFRELLPKKEAIHALHFPNDELQMEQGRRTLAFEEFARLQVNVLFGREREATAGIAFSAPPTLTTLLESRLPFQITPAQRKAVDEIFGRMESPKKMNVLLQGDVGSGKTIVALHAILKAIENGKQAALMAPTQILAEQHYATIRQLLKGSMTRIHLLTSSCPAEQKTEIREVFSLGGPGLIIGTHALLSASILLPDIGLVVIDEQHRFGVNQRAALAAKGIAADLLIMSATPIPRTLALVLYGDFEAIYLNELPANRIPVLTKHVEESNRQKMIAFCKKELEAGRQLFVVCPEIGKTDAATGPGFSHVRQAYSTYRKWFPGQVVGAMHGQMALKEREAVLNRFQKNQIQILITTTVIEVGVDVPNASLMIIEGAEKFGLTQLHQLRGRVGRSRHKSYCFVFTDALLPRTTERIAAFTATTDGFQIAEQDLLLRGPGEFLGTAQSGIPKLRVGHLIRDAHLLKAAREDIESILQRDPSLASPEHSALRSLVGPPPARIQL